jgi:hypothetical protein
MLKSGSLAEGQDRVAHGVRVLSGGFPDTRRLDVGNLLVWVTACLFFTLLGVGLYHQALKPDFPPNHLTYLPLKEEVILSGRVYRPSRLGPEWVRLYLAVEA